MAKLFPAAFRAAQHVQIYFLSVYMRRRANIAATGTVYKYSQYFSRHTDFTDRLKGAWTYNNIVHTNVVIIHNELFYDTHTNTHYVAKCCHPVCACYHALAFSHAHAHSSDTKSIYMIHLTDINGIRSNITVKKYICQICRFLFRVEL